MLTECEQEPRARDQRLQWHYWAGDWEKRGRRLEGAARRQECRLQLKVELGIPLEEAISGYHGVCAKGQDNTLGR